MRTALRDQEDEIRQLKRVHDEQKLFAADLQEQLARSDAVKKVKEKEAMDIESQLETLLVSKCKNF